MTNNNWEEELAIKLKIITEEHDKWEYAIYLYSPLKTFIKSLLDTKDKEIQEKLEEQKKEIIKSLPEIHYSAKSLLIQDCPECGLVVNRSFIDRLTMEIQDEYKQKLINTINNLSKGAEVTATGGNGGGQGYGGGGYCCRNFSSHGH